MRSIMWAGWYAYSNYINNQMNKEGIMMIIKRTLKGQKSFLRTQ